MGRILAHWALDPTSHEVKLALGADAPDAADAAASKGLSAESVESVPMDCQFIVPTPEEARSRTQFARNREVGGTGFVSLE